MTNWKRISFMMMAASLFVSWVHTAAIAGPFEDGKAAYDRKDYQTAMHLWQPLAAQGKEDAQTYIGEMYYNGLGVKQDFTKALKWLRKAAKRGYAPAQSDLGVFYANDQGGKQDYAEAAKWFRKAAEQGDAGAQDTIGWQYTTGHGVAQNIDEGRKWFLRGANQGNVGAMVHLTEGYAMESNEQELYFWYSIIANLPNADKSWSGYRDHEAKWITPAQKAAVDARLQNWKPILEKH